ncbi:MAG: hypothetical protein LLG15_13105 [Betaproteobacteria bacterium]|nr:hypothetical protein [Betaproteobacteria bacterium]
MSNCDINILDLPDKPPASFSEKNGIISVRADNPVSALQAVARHANIKILLSPADVERLTGAGKIDIALDYPNNAAAAAKTAKEIDDMATKAFAALARQKRQRSFWRMTVWLVLAAGIIALGFVAAFALLDAANGSRALQGF